MKSKILGLVALVVLAGPTATNAIELRFSEAQMPLGSISGQTDVPTAAYSAFGIQVTYVYRYLDSRDPFSDGAENYSGMAWGISNRFEAGSPARIDFLTPVSGLAFDWWTIDGAGQYYLGLSAFDSSNNLLYSFTGSGSGTEGPGLAGVSYLTFTGGGAVGISNLRFDVPEPGTLALLGLGLAGLCLSRRRRPE
jgi:hypothetical protein